MQTKAVEISNSGQIGSIFVAQGAQRVMLGASIYDWGGPVRLGVDLWGEGSLQKFFQGCFDNLFRDVTKGTETNAYRTAAFTSHPTCSRLGMMKVKHCKTYRTEPELQQSHRSSLVRVKTNLSSFLRVVRFIRGRVKAHSNASAE